LEQERSSASEELERLLEYEQNDHVKRVLEGDRAAPKKPKRLTRIANLNEQIAGIDMALPIHRRRVGEARSALSEANAKVAEAVLPSLVAQKTNALEQCSEPLERLIDALVDLAAVDALQERFAGPDGSILVTSEIDAGALFSGRIILDRFRKSLPPRFANLAADTFANIDNRVGERLSAFADQIGA
jgi:hypothetical protein